MKFMNKKIVSLLAISILFVTPGIILAAPVDFGTPPDVQINPIDPAGNSPATLANIIGKALDLMWIVFIAFAIIMFMIAGFQFLSAQGEPDGVGKARKSVIWGSAGVVVAVAAFVVPFIIRSFTGL